ncbi:MerR family transcriptional regulator [Varunaivibrio sulfuroxidans]|uniref:DNA-binding transcriptional MerR regulator n=1 Tax=Varunaivibrio sulfuroxidans TaxID=1773489 RepID=A0A4V2UNQ4_9PROT|nr:helix-turn-helix domain-containing protein [Varunaivibrio sulfuroxidans]TCS62951.1 DNA-binding transcriptional MerR regulator [Varunaivibrio sulfuroxidans]WES31973.1 helix-turn-helix domain-containing protein [Varunaivibrio sulfuroxidans]
MLNDDMTIGRLARETGCKAPTIRYYEEIGLMPQPFRTDGNQRRYGSRHLGRLTFIRHGRELGFSLDAIREFLSLADNPEQPCEAADRIARAQLEAVESRIARLNALKVELKRMIAQCKGKRISECRIIEVLADHGECLHEDHAKSV